MQGTSFSVPPAAGRVEKLSNALHASGVDLPEEEGESEALSPGNVRQAPLRTAALIARPNCRRYTAIQT